MTRIVVIGGGSYSWGPKFLRDIFATPELQGSTIVLHDLVEQRVDLVYTLARKMIEAFNLDFRLEKTLSLATALQGADFVILTITTGRLEAMRADLEIPAAYGIRQAVGDTTGPGGLARALRNIPVVAEIARKVDELCPRRLVPQLHQPHVRAHTHHLHAPHRPPADGWAVSRIHRRAPPSGVSHRRRARTDPGKSGGHQPSRLDHGSLRQRAARVGRDAPHCRQHP
jgi:hypothetical protein